MASVSHIAVGMAVGRLHAGADARASKLALSLVAFGALAALPDADVTMDALSLGYLHPLSHRGAAHSLTFAAVVGAAAAVLARLCGGRAGRLGLLVFLAVASHGLLDSVTERGKGVALLWPFSDERLHAPIWLIPSVPVVERFSTLAGLRATAIELLVSMPLLLYALWPRRKRARRI
jgi:inner membrane protein